MIYISQVDKATGYASMMSTDKEEFLKACYHVGLDKIGNDGKANKRQYKNLYSARLTKEQKQLSYNITHAVHCKNGIDPGCYEFVKTQLLNGDEV